MKIAKQFVCFLFGHNTILKDWYPNDAVSKITCLRCDCTIKQYPNPAYHMIKIIY